MGLLKRKIAINLKKEKELIISITLQGEKLKKEGFLEEKFLKKEFPIKVNALNDIEKHTYLELKKRKGILITEEEKTTTIELTNLGKKLISKENLKEINKPVINRLTKSMLKSKEWKNKKFRAYDIEINVPKIYPGKKHFVNQAVDYIRTIWLELGFKEMSGNYVQSSFWDLDALFVPQDHPAREMQDTFYLNGKAKLPEFWKNIKETHETGGNTKSKGWNYKFSKKETETLLLRTHTTVLSAKTISKLKKEDLPAKFFAIGKVFRNETLDWKHLFEFYQVEGIVIDPNANPQPF